MQKQTYVPFEQLLFHGMKKLYSARIETPLGRMIVIADERRLYLLDFQDSPGVEDKVACLKNGLQATIVPGMSLAILSIQKELIQYFSGDLKEFITPIALTGTQFQNMVWKSLTHVPFGSTMSYSQVATFIGRPLSARAVADALSQNYFTVLLPCHRIIKSNGDLSGYSGGIVRKAWLLAHETQLATL